MSRNNNYKNLGIGPMSSEVIESVYKYSAINNKPLMLIASKNQIDHSSGYVNNWNTKQYSLFLKSLKKKYKNSKVKICRDHCGPGFNGNYSIKDVFETIDSDIENNFDLIHIDFSKAKTDYDKILKLSKEAILYAKSLNPKIQIEIGTDENFGQKLSTINIQEFIREMNFFLNFITPEYYVVPTGSLVLEDKQFGFFNKNFINSIYDKIDNKIIRLKEHNADYLYDEEIKLRKEHITALNIAPQFGVSQTMFVINECIKYGINTDDFLDTSYKSNKWKKWLFKINKSNRFKCSILSGHYNFYHKSYKNMVDQLRKIDPEIDNKIINSNYDIIDHYVKNFY
jgi:hypothetical protein